MSVLVTSTDTATSRTSEHGVEVLRAGRWATLASTPLSPRLAFELRRQRPDITHLPAPYPPGEVAHLLWGRSRATVLTHHSDIVRQRRLGRLYRGLQRRVLAKVDRILVTSPPYLASSATLQPHLDRCTVLPLGVDLSRFGGGTQAAEHRRRLGEPLVLFVGRLRYYKGLEHLLRAMDSVPAHLAVVGRGPLEARCHHLAENGRAAGRIHFLGDLSQDDLTGLYQAADVFVLPSIARSEAYGLVLLEAMAAGTPVISTELGTGTSWVNRHGETGLVVEPGDPQALAGALTQLLKAPERRAAMGRAARRRAEELSAERMIDATLEIYRELLESR